MCVLGVKNATLTESFVYIIRLFKKVEQYKKRLILFNCYKIVSFI